MKKRKILLGLALAAAAVFSLSACGDDTPTTDPTPTVDPTPDSGSTVTPAAEKVKVQYYKVIEGESPVEITGAKQEIDKGSTTTKPETALAVDGYRIVECYTSAGCTDVFDFTKAINADTKVYVKYVQITKYDELSASANKVLAFDFNSDMTLDIDDSLKFEATAPKVVAKNDKIKVQNDVLSLGTATSGTDGAIVDFGQKITKPGLYNIYYEITFAAKTGQGESIAQINGTTDGTNYARVFELRNESAGLGYSFDGSTKLATDPAVALAANKTIKILIELNTAEGTIKVYNDGEKVVDTTTSITGVNGLKFQQNGAKSNLEIDNVAVTFEEKAATGLVAAKAAAVKVITDYKATSAYTDLGDTAGNTSANAALKKLIDAQIATSTEAINSATTEDAVATAKTAWETFAAAEKPVVTVAPYSAANTVYTEGGNYYIAVVSGSTVDLTGVTFTGTSIDKFYTAADLATEYSATTTITAATTICAKVNVVSKTVITVNSITVDGSADKATTDLGNGFTYVAKSGSANRDVASKNVTIEGTAITSAINTGGKSDANKNYVEIDLSSVATTVQKKITVYLAGGGSGTRSGYFASSKDSLTSGVPSDETKLATISSVEQAVVHGDVTLTGGAKYYFVYDNSVHIYGFIIEDVA